MHPVRMPVTPRPPRSSFLSSNDWARESQRDWLIAISGPVSPATAVRSMPRVCGLSALFAATMGIFDMSGGMMFGGSKLTADEKYEMREMQRTRFRQPVEETVAYLGLGRGTSGLFHSSHVDGPYTRPRVSRLRALSCHPRVLISPRVFMDLACSDAFLTCQTSSRLDIMNSARRSLRRSMASKSKHLQRTRTTTPETTERKKATSSRWDGPRMTHTARHSKPSLKRSGGPTSDRCTSHMLEIRAGR